MTRTKGRDHDHLAGQVAKPRNGAVSRNRAKRLRRLTNPDLIARASEYAAEINRRLEGAA